MNDETEQTGVDILFDRFFELYLFTEGIPDELHEAYEKAKETDREKMIKLIQFIVSEKELVDYGSVSKETANYYLDKFIQEGNK